MIDRENDCAVGDVFLPMNMHRGLEEALDSTHPKFAQRENETVELRHGNPIAVHTLPDTCEFKTDAVDARAEAPQPI